jgi:hypothetical protein
MTSKTLQQFAKFDDNVYPFRIQEGTIIDSVPPAYYHVASNGPGSYYLTQKSEDLKLPEKIYGSTLPRAARIWSAFHAQSQPMAVGLFGAKGAGKTLLSTVIANQAIALGLPVVDVSASFSTDKAYLAFLNSLGNCVIVFDEFLKHLSKQGDVVEQSKSDIALGRQDEMLTFFSGSNNSKRLVILIDNQQYMLSDFFKNRPSRMRYSFDYKGIETEVVMSIAKDAGLNEAKSSMLATYAQRYGCTFDTVKEIVNEWVLFPEDTIEEITGIMNVPRIYQPKKNNARIVSFKHNNVDFSLDNELAEECDGSVYFSLSRTNPFFGKVFETEEEFNKYRDEDLEDYSWIDFDDYQSDVKNRRMTERFNVGNSNLVAMKSNMVFYKTPDFTLQVEIMGLAEVEPIFDVNAF